MPRALDKLDNLMVQAVESLSYGWRRRLQLTKCLIECENVKILWHDVESWIAEIGCMDYLINDNIIVLGELQKAHWLNAIILITKKTIFNAKTNLTSPSLECVKRQVKHLFNYERQKYTCWERG